MHGFGGISCGVGVLFVVLGVVMLRGVYGL